MKRSEFLRFAIISMLFYFSNSLWQSFFSLFLDFKGFNVIEIGVLRTSIISLRFILSFLAGLLVDKYGSKFGALFSEALLVLFLFLVNYTTVFPHALLLCFLASFALSLYVQLAVKFVSLISEERSTGFLFALYYFAINLVQALGPGLSGVIVEYYGYYLLNWLTMSLFMVVFALTIPIFPKTSSYTSSPETGVRVSAVLRRKEVLFLTLALILHDFSIFISVSYIPLFTKHVLLLSEASIGLLLVIKSFSRIVFQILSGKIIDRIGGRITLLLHFIFTSIGYIGIGLVRNFSEMAIVNAFMGIAITLDLPARRYLLSKYAPKSFVASVSGFSDTLVGLFTISSPVIGGYLWYTTGSRSVFVLSGLANFSAIVPLLFLRVKAQGQKSLER